MTNGNPFRPGAGRTPPHLAGREAVQRLFKEELDTMIHTKEGNIIVMYGPRGMGKTVLLHDLEKMCSARHVAATVTTPSERLRSVEDLPGLLLPQNRLADALPPKIAGYLPKALSRRGYADPNALREHLARACLAGPPRALLVDEAHANADMAAYRALVNAVQGVLQEAPFLLVLAGTPELPAFLRDAGFTFIERARYVGVGCLNESASVEAIRIPIEKAGKSIATDALDAAVADSYGYPYFLQQWGKSLWDQASARGAAAISQTDVALAQPDISAERQGFYGRRYNAMLGNTKLLAAANAIANACSEQGSIEMVQALATIQSSLPQDEQSREEALALYNELIRQDFVWEPPNSDKLMQGIPSFMQYSKDAYKKEQTAL